MLKNKNKKKSLKNQKILFKKLILINKINYQVHNQKKEKLKITILTKQKKHYDNGWTTKI